MKKVFYELEAELMKTFLYL